MAIILADLELDKETIVAGILHDVVEDTDDAGGDCSRSLAKRSHFLLMALPSLTQLIYSQDKVEVQAENLRKMFLAMAKDIRVILIKLADRLHNMRTLKYMTPTKQKEKARETMDIYAPIAQRLGISKIKMSWMTSSKISGAGSLLRLVKRSEPGKQSARICAADCRRSFESIWKMPDIRRR